MFLLFFLRLFGSLCENCLPKHTRVIEFGNEREFMLRCEICRQPIKKCCALEFRWEFSQH